MDEDWTTEDVVKDAACWPNRRLGEPRGIDRAAFDRWLARVRAEAAREALTRYESLLTGAAISIGGYNLDGAVQLRGEATNVRGFRDREYPQQEADQ